jgi:hypothetical protein
VAYKKTHPGLDEVLTDEALDAFIWGPYDDLEGPPVRLWPRFLTVAAVCLTTGVVAGVLVAPFVTWVHVVLTVSAVAVAAVSVVVIEHRDGQER